MSNNCDWNEDQQELRELKKKRTTTRTQTETQRLTASRNEASL